MGLLPDLFGLCVILVILHFLRIRHAGEDVHLWFTGLMLLLGESVAHILYQCNLPLVLHRVSHVAALDCYAIAGAVFLYAALHRLLPPRSLGLALVASTVVRMGALTLYGADLRAARPFYLLAAAGLAISFVNTVALRCRRRSMILLSYVVLWAIFCFAVRRADYRFAAYWLLCCLYFQIAVYFFRTMPARSIGKYTVVSGFAIWAMLFLAHSSVGPNSRYFDLTDRLWSLEKFQIAVGMLIVMLETQVERTNELALHDPLTGLPNRRLLDDRLGQAILQAARTRTRVGFLMLDLNDFKDVNDRYGHDCGDRVLCAISSNLGRVLRSSDTIARLGGDEFAIVVSGFTTDEPLTGQILRAVHMPVNHVEGMIAVTASLGSAIYPDDTSDLTRLRQLADERMYLQKRGRQPQRQAAKDYDVGLGLQVETNHPLL